MCQFSRARKKYFVSNAQYRVKAAGYLSAEWLITCKLLSCDEKKNTHNASYQRFSSYSESANSVVPPPPVASCWWKMIRPPFKEDRGKDFSLMWRQQRLIFIQTDLRVLTAAAVKWWDYGWMLLPAGNNRLARGGSISCVNTGFPTGGTTSCASIPVLLWKREGCNGTEVTQNMI